MNLTGNDSPASSDPDASGAVMSRFGRWLSAAGIAFLAVLIALELNPGHGSAVLVLAASAAYLLAFAVFMATASLAHSGHWTPLALGVTAGLLCSLGVGGFRWSGALTLAPVILPAVVVGLISRTKPAAIAFWSGAATLVSVMIIRDATTWVGQIELLQEAAPFVARDVTAQLSPLGLAGATAEADWIRRIELLSWYLPGLLTASALVPFSIGSLWFFARTARATGQPNDSGFTRWRMPRSFLLLALLSGLGHLMGGVTVRQVSDNVLLALAVAFAIVGTAALEYFFRARSWSGWIRVVIYIALIVAHGYGLIVLIAIGLIDALLGWRRGKEARPAGKESVS